MSEIQSNQSVANILGPWADPNFESGLIERLRNAWDKPIRDLTNSELATFLRQNIATEQILPIAQGRLTSGVVDDTEIFDGELDEAVDRARSHILSSAAD